MRLYKDMGETYTDDEKPKRLSRWFKEKWRDIAGVLKKYLVNIKLHEFKFNIIFNLLY